MVHCLAGPLANRFWGSPPCHWSEQNYAHRQCYEFWVRLRTRPLKSIFTSLQVSLSDVTLGGIIAQLKCKFSSAVPCSFSVWAGPSWCHPAILSFGSNWMPSPCWWETSPQRVKVTKYTPVSWGVGQVRVLPHAELWIVARIFISSQHKKTLFPVLRGKQISCSDARFPSCHSPVENLIPYATLDIVDFALLYTYLNLSASLLNSPWISSIHFCTMSPEGWILGDVRQSDWTF